MALIRGPQHGQSEPDPVLRPYGPSLRRGTFARPPPRSIPPELQFASIPPPRKGSGARRVHSTIPSGAGSPDATPSVNGLLVSFGAPTEMYGEAMVRARYWPVLARKAPSLLECLWFAKTFSPSPSHPVRSAACLYLGL